MDPTGNTMGQKMITEAPKDSPVSHAKTRHNCDLIPVSKLIKKVANMDPTGSTMGQKMTTEAPKEYQKGTQWTFNGPPKPVYICKLLLATKRSRRKFV